MKPKSMWLWAYRQAGDLERMAMQVNRMIVAALITHRQSVVFAFS
jgi:hypothetical protein